MRREKKRDDRDFDQTQLKLNQHGKMLHRDFTAHFFRWSFARRFVKPTDHVLEVGCGQELPLQRILFTNAKPYAASYVGVDLSKVKPCGNQHCKVLGEFDFTRRWKELRAYAPGEGYDVAVHLEVIEHMKVEHGRAMLKSLFELLKPGGVMLMSTPCYDGKRHAANHCHEYFVAELQEATEKTGFVVERRFGTFMDIRHIGKVAMQGVTNDAINQVRKALGAYFDNDALSNFFGPLYPDHARNNLWICRKPIVTRGKTPAYLAPHLRKGKAND